jgi:hypothetical protein
MPLAILVSTPPAAAQISAFSYDSSRVPVGRAYEYVKSNRDGTHATQVTVYVASLDRLESLKWDSGGDAATLVTATLDWERFSVRTFESRRLRRDGPDALQGTLSTDPERGALLVSFAPDSAIPVRMWPWHSYDFDFASLNLAMPHLIDPESPFDFERVDVVYEGNPPGFADLGPVEVRFAAREERLGRQTRLYELSGRGLGDRRGSLWTAVDGGYVVEFELPFPDEPGFTDVRFRLQSITEISPADWEAYKRERIGESP